MAAAQLGDAKRPRTGRNVELAALHSLLDKYSKLAATAERAHDGEAFRVWSAAVERVATTLLQHQSRQPVTTASRATRFEVAIFRDGKPVNVVPAPPAAATSGDVVDVVAQPASAPEPEPPPEPQQLEPLVTADALAKSATLRIANQHNDPLPPPDPPGWASRSSTFGNPFFRLGAREAWHFALVIHEPQHQPQ
jgi:hypothetical protein